MINIGKTFYLLKMLIRFNLIVFAMIKNKLGIELLLVSIRSKQFVTLLYHSYVAAHRNIQGSAIVRNFRFKK